MTLRYLEFFWRKKSILGFISLKIDILKSAMSAMFYIFYVIVTSNVDRFS